ncbi:Smp-2p [Mactra antiquata]
MNGRVVRVWWLRFGKVKLHGTRGRFTAIAIDYQVLAGDRKYYDVMFIGTSEGRVLKSINAGSEGPVDSVVIEDIQVLEEGEAIKELKIFKSGVESKLIVISKKNIKAIPLQRCSRQKSCGDCVALQDPYCYWMSDECITHTSRGLQDLRHGDRSKCPDGGLVEVEIVVEETVVTTEEPVQTETPSCPVCSCNCSQSETNTEYTVSTSEQNIDELLVWVTVTMATYTFTCNNNYNNRTLTHMFHTILVFSVQTIRPLRPIPDPEDTGVDFDGQQWKQPCDPQYDNVRSEGQIYTASTLAIASVVSIVVAALVGFVIGYRVSLCRNQARDTEQVINYEQSFGSLRKHSNRHSSINESNFYADPAIQKQYKNNIQQSNILVSNNITNKNPNLPNGSIESKTMTPKQASKTYL